MLSKSWPATTFIDCVCTSIYLFTLEVSGISVVGHMIHLVVAVGIDHENSAGK